MLSKLPQTGTSIFSIMTQMANEYGAINLSQGFPGFDVSPELTELVNFYMKKGLNQYAPMPGVPQLRKKIADKINAAHGIDVDTNHNITITAGATQGIYTCITAIVHPGDEVIYFEPAYDSYKPGILLNGGVPVTVSLSAPDFTIPWEEVRNKITERTKLIIINTPHNPSGSIIDSHDLEELTQIANEHDLFVLSDEVYEHIVFDNKEHFSVLRSPGLKDRHMAVFSFGKTFHATGWKVGYVVAPQQLMNEIIRLHQYMLFSVNTPIQYALAEYLENEENYLGLPDFYQEKRDYFLNLMKSSRLKALDCSGTYFQTFSYGHISDEGDMEMAAKLTKEHGVASIPISAFYENGHNDHLLRFCFAKEKEELKQAAEILCKI